MKFLRLSAIALLATVSFASQSTFAQNRPSEDVRVMTYNIQWFHAGEDAKRISNIKEILTDVKPHIVGLQEIEGKAALAQIFAEPEWTIGIKDAPDEFQECGIAVKAPFRLESWELLFGAKELDFAFPGKRDVLHAIVRTPQGKKLSVYVHHMKSRSGGRMQTDPRRAMAASMIAAHIAHANEPNVIVLGDLNDAPNDQCANILESGNSMAKGGPKGEYTLLANLTEELADKDWTTIGVHDLFFGDPVSAKVIGAKAENDRLRDRDYRFPQDVKITQTFFDQILVSPYMLVNGAKATVYDKPAALRGLRGRVSVSENEMTGARTVQYTENGTLASDHLPVYADLKVR